MDTFTARNALQTGFDLIRRRPMLVLLWAAAPLAQALAFTAISREFLAMTRAAIFSGRPLGLANGQFLALTIANLLLSLLIASLLWCSAYRALLRPAERPSVRFGREELAVFGVWFPIQLIAMIASAALQFVIGGRFAVSGFGVEEYSVAAVEALGLFWGAVAAAWTFGQGQIAPLRCWTIARGRFWLLAGLAVGVAVLDRLARFGVGQLTLTLRRLFPVSRISPTQPFGVAPPSVLDVVQVPLLTQYALMAAVGALEIAFIAGIVACAYRAAAAKPQAATFSSVVSGPAS